MSSGGYASRRNPRDKASADKYCSFIYSEGDARAGERCGSIHMKGSKFCYFHQPDQDKIRQQLAEAREARKGFPNEKHGFYTQSQKECDDCQMSGGCRYYEEGKKVCDFQLKQDIDLNDMESIKKYTEEILKTEMQRYKKLEPVFEQDIGNVELHHLSSMVGKRITAMLKDYAQIKEIYDKRQKPQGWKSILNSNSESERQI